MPGRPPEFRALRELRQQPPAPPDNSPDAQKAREVLGLYLRNGQRQAYSGEQVTRLLEGKVKESRQIVKHQGPGRDRFEYVSPSSLKGEVLVLNGREILNYKPRDNKLLVGPAPLEELMAHIGRIFQSLREGRIQAHAVGNEVVAGQSTTIVEVRPRQGGSAYKRFWIDNATGVRLKTEDVNFRGAVVATSYFTHIDYNPKLDRRDFSQDAWAANVQREPLFPRGRPLASLQDAQGQAGYSVREPVLKPGFHLSGVWVLRAARPIAVLRYTDGVNTFALSQQPEDPARPRRNAWDGKAHTRWGTTHWRAAGRVFTLIGNLRPDTVQDIVNSLQ